MAGSKDSDPIDPSVSYPNGNVTSYRYDALNRLVALTTTDASDAVVADYRYELDLTGRRTGVQELHNGRSTGYSYDELYRLVGETITDPVNGGYSAEYQYDKVGNRSYSIVDGVHTAYSYDANDRLTQQGGVSYSYDANGNTLTETEDGQVTRYTYDARNKLVETTRPGYSASYGYNADGIRTRRTENGATTQFVVDSNRDYAQVLAEVSNGITEVSYSYGDDLLAQQRSGATSYYLYDGHGSTRALADEGSTVTDTYHYDAFGVLLASTGDTENDYLYTGEQRDAGLEQYYLRARYYDQGAGRFTQMDTWMGHSHDPVTLHKYLYANADPANNIDPTGNFSIGGVMTSVGISVSLNLANSYFNGGLTADSIASSVLYGTVEGVAFYGAAIAVLKTGARLTAAARTAILSRQLQNTFKATSNLGPLIPGFKHLAYTFQLETRVGKFFISSGSGASASNGVSGALKHIVGDLISKSGGAITTELAEALVIQEVQLAIEAAAVVGFNYGKKVVVNTSGAQWELIFEAPKVAGQLPKLFHMLRL